MSKWIINTAHMLGGIFYKFRYFQKYSVILLFTVLTSTYVEAAPRAAVFDFELIDTSAEGEADGKRADQQNRLVLLTETLRQALRDKGVYEIVDIASQRPAIAKSPDLHSCNGCAENFAKALNADVAIIGYVQKVSNLILNINVEFRDVTSGAVVKAGSADIRGNTDESWLHGLRWLIKNRLIK